jgi:uncharacterized membrane protein
MDAVNRNLMMVRGKPVARGSAHDLGAVLRRAAIFAVGAALMARVRKRSLVARLMTAAGAMLVSRAAAGHDDLGRLALWFSPRGENRDAIDTVVEESFPASDAPSWPSTVASMPR